jgi:outer membrane protein TolC
MKIAGFNCQRRGWLRRGVATGLLCLGAPLLSAGPAGAAPEAARLTADLTLKELVRRVLEHNENIQARMLEVEINRRKYRGERGIFEPEFVASYDHQENKRENTTEQFLSSTTEIFQERNNIYNAGIESLIPTGARLRLGYTLRDLDNNLQTRPFFFQRPSQVFSNGEWVTFVGASVTQPLLKNAGLTATLANLRLAAMNSEIAFQDFRRQMMLTLSTAEAAYWNLYMAQEQLLFFRESVALAASILQDNRERLQAGKGSGLEVLEAGAALALRRSKQEEAREKYFEALNRLSSMFASSPADSNRFLIAVDAPALSDGPPGYGDVWVNAFELNPDYLAQRKRVLADNIRLAYAKNQRWPQLDLKASYGLNGLGDSAEASHDDITRQGFPSWSVGLEMRIPLGGGIKGKHELAAARVRQKQSLVALKEIETTIVNGLDTALHKVRRARDSVANYRTVVDFNQNLLESRLAQLAVGRVESRKVLEVEADLFEAKNAVVEALVQYQRALLELELIQGVTLRSRQLDLTQRELEAQTARLVRRGQLTDADYANFIQEVQYEFRQRGPGMDAAQEAEARRLLREHTAAPPSHPAPTRPLTPEEYEKALRILREQTHPTEPTPPR